MFYVIHSFVFLSARFIVAHKTIAVVRISLSIINIHHRIQGHTDMLVCMHLPPDWTLAIHDRAKTSKRNPKLRPA